MNGNASDCCDTVFLYIFTVNSLSCLHPGSAATSHRQFVVQLPNPVLDLETLLLISDLRAANRQRIQTLGLNGSKVVLSDALN
jgi:hypothetical protein